MCVKGREGGRETLLMFLFLQFSFHTCFRSDPSLIEKD